MSKQLKTHTSPRACNSVFFPMPNQTGVWWSMQYIAVCMAIEKPTLAVASEEQCMQKQTREGAVWRNHLVHAIENCSLQLGQASN